MDNLPLYQKYLNLENATFSLIEHEDAMVAIVYKIAQPNLQELILKICTRPNDYLREVYCLKHFAGKLPVARIVKTIEPKENRHGAILMECLPGGLLKTADFTGALAFETGALLARIHLNRTPGYGDLIQPESFSPDPRIHFTLKFDEGFAECASHLPKTLLERCRSYYDKHVDLLTLADGPCIVHRDFRPGNLMIYNGKVQGVIDWASARASFAQEDFCSLEHGEWPNRPASKNSFLAGYASIRPVPDYSAMMPLLRLNKAIATIGFTVKQGTWQSSHTRIYQYNRRFLETFLEVK